MLGSIFALLSAITFAFTNASLRRGVLKGTVGQAVAVSMPVGVVVFFVGSLGMGSLAAVASFSAEALLWLCAAGIVHFVWGRYCNARATKAIGANLVGPIQEFNLVVALVLAIVVLEEVVTPLRAFGIVCIFVGPALSFKRKTLKPAIRDLSISTGNRQPTLPDGQKQFQPNYAEGYVFAILSALGFGISPILISKAVGGAGAGMSIAGGLVSYLAATLVLAPLLLNASTMRSMRALEPEPARWFTIAAVSVSISQLFRYMALSVAPVLVVAPILRLSLVFRLMFSRLMNREHEVFGGRVIAGTAISLTGALALTISTDFIINMIPLPAAIVEVVSWQWP